MLQNRLIRVSRQLRVSQNLHVHPSTSLILSRGVSFGDTKSAYQDRTTPDLIRSWIVFKLCGMEPLVKNARSLIQISNSVLGVPLTNRLVKGTFFSQFCAGENETDIAPTIDSLRSKGIGAILDYAAEGEPDAPTNADGDTEKSTAVVKTEGLASDNFSPIVLSTSDPRRPFSTNVAKRPLNHVLSGIPSTDLAEEEEFDKNMRLSMKGISAAKGSGGFVAVKVSALTNPNLLQQVSDVLHGHRRRFRSLLSEDYVDQDLTTRTFSKNGSNFECKFHPHAAFQYCPSDAVTPVLEFLHSSHSNDESSNGITLTPKDNPYLFGSVQKDQFVSGMLRQRTDLANDTLYRREVLEIIFDAMDSTCSGHVDYLTWSDFSSLLSLGDEESLQPLLEKLRECTDLPNHELHQSLNAMFSQGPNGDPVPHVSRDDRARWQSMIQRTEDLALHAIENKVTVMIDAEHTFVQPAIDWAVTYMQRQFNRNIVNNRTYQYPEIAHLSSMFANTTLDSDKFPYLDSSLITRVNQRVKDTASSSTSTTANVPFPVVFNTLQGYLKDSASRMLLGIARAEKEGFLNGIKLVRGAYMIQERERSMTLGYNDPIFPSKEKTDANYDACMGALLYEVGTKTGEIVIASHNEESIAQCIKLMKQKNISSTDGVFFSQLLGMCDYITVQLGQGGYNAFKYVPYGPVQEVIPYLIRRAEENGDIVAGGAGKETQLLTKEIKRRLWSR